MNIDQIAELCHEVNRGYCESTGDYSQNKWSESPSWQKESAIAGVKYHIENDTTPEYSHNNWMKQKIEDGWIYGETKDVENKKLTLVSSPTINFHENNELKIICLRQFVIILNLIFNQRRLFSIGESFILQELRKDVCMINY